MDSIDSSSRNIANNNFGDNITIYQGNIQNPVTDQTAKCLKDLRLTDPRDDKTRIQQTKGGLLKESSNWIFKNETFKQWRDDEQNTLLWIKGDPGKGKTMLLCAIIDELMPKTKLAKSIDRTTNTFLSYFFCQGTDSRINNATAVLRGLIYLIIIQEPSLISHVQEKYNHAGKDLFLDANAWVALSEIFRNILRDQKVGDVVLVVDALDECETDSFKLLDFITQNASLPHVNWVISSRNILSIQQRLKSYISQGILSLELKANAETVSNGVDIYIEHKISRLHSIQHNQDQKDALRHALRQKANGTFLWVSLVMKELEDVQSWEAMEVVKEMPMDLTAVYRRMIDQIWHQRRRNAEFCWKILSTIFTAYYPLSLEEVRALSGLPKEISENFESFIALVTLCGSFLTIREGIIYFIHQSAKDFLSTEVFPVRPNAGQRHAYIFEQSITAISKLPQNMYGLLDAGFRSKNAPPPNPSPLASMRYACFCWTDHFCDAYGVNPQPETGLALKEKLWSFLKDHVLRWLESIILLGRLLDALPAIQKILRVLQFDTDSPLPNFLRTTEKFIINNGSIIDRAPLQLYGSALVFSQTSSDIKQHQWKERLPLIEDVQGSIRTNNALLQTLEGHKSKVNAICFALNGKMIASGCQDGTILVWDAATGAIQHTLTNGGRSISAVSFSSDCKSLVFVFFDIHNISGSQINLVTVSLDRKIPWTQLNDSTIQLNGTAAYGRSHVWRRRHTGMGLPVVATFSLDSITVATTEFNGPIELWDTATGIRLRAFQKIDPNTANISCIAFSPDSKTIASGHSDETVNLWDVETGACFRTFRAPHWWVLAIAFRLDGKKLALGLFGYGEKMWLLDMATCRNEITHISHDYDKISAIAFSPDSKTIASASSDTTIRLWDANLGTQPWTTEDGPKSRTSDRIVDMVLSPGGKILALLKSENLRVELWDTTKGIRQNTFEGPKVSYGTGVMAFSPSGRTLAIGRNGIWLWNVATGQYIVHRPPRNYGYNHTAIAFSPNGEELASTVSGTEIQLQKRATGHVQRIFDSNRLNAVETITFSPDSKAIVAAYRFGLIIMWDTTTGARLQEFTSGLSLDFRYKSIKYLPDGPFLCLNHRYIVTWSRQNAKSPKHDCYWLMKNGSLKEGNPFFGFPENTGPI